MTQVSLDLSLLSTRGQSQEFFSWRQDGSGDLMEPFSHFHVAFVQWFSTSVDFSPPLPRVEDISQCLRTMWVATTWRGWRISIILPRVVNRVAANYHMYDEQDIPLPQRFTRCMMSLLLRLNNPTELLVGLMGVESRWTMPAGCPHCHPLHRLLRNGLPLINRFLSPSVSSRSRLRLPFV